MRIKKILSLFLVLLLSFSSMSFSVNFPDLDNFKWAETSIQNMVLNGYIKGYPDGTFRPNGEITRAEFVTILNKMNGFIDEQELSFKDVSSNHWAYKEISKAVAAGYINGYPDGTFRPDSKISREQIAMMINNLYHLENKTLSQPLKDLNKISNWAVQAVVNVIANGIMVPKADGNFYGSVNAIRADSVVALNVLFINEIPTVEKWLVSQEIKTGSIGTVNGGGSTSTPADTEVIKSLETVVSRMNNEIMPVLKTSLQVSAANIIVDSISKYMSDTTYDTSQDVNSAKNLVKQMTESEYREFKNAITSRIGLQFLIDLNNVFQLIEY